MKPYHTDALVIQSSTSAINIGEQVPSRHKIMCLFFLFSWVWGSETRTETDRKIEITPFHCCISFQMIRILLVVLTIWHNTLYHPFLLVLSHSKIEWQPYQLFILLFQTRRAKWWMESILQQNIICKHTNSIEPLRSSVFGSPHLVRPPLPSLLLSTSPFARMRF